MPANRLLGGLPSLGVKRPWLVLVMNLLIAIAGFAALLAIEIRELPDVDSPVVNIRAVLPGASPETMDSEVTRILEGAVARVSGVKEINSSSEENNTRISAEFMPGVDVDRAAADVREAVSRVERNLPDSLEQVSVFKSDQDAEEIVRIAVISEAYSEEALARIVEQDIVPAFISLPGVADVPIFGSRDRILRVILDPLRLTSFGLAVSDVADVLRRAPLDVPAGSFRSGDQNLLVRADAAVTAEDDIGALIIRDNIRINDVATVVFSPKDANNIVRLNGEQVIGIGVVRQAGSNTIEISDGIAAAIETINARYTDLQLKKISDNAIFIRGAVSEVLTTLLISILVVILTIRAFSGSWVLTLVPAVAIPVSLMGTMAASWILGFSINILTLLALVLATGLIVDDAIVVLESVQRRFKEGWGKAAASLVGTHQVFFAVISTTLVLIAVFIPIAFLPGTAGRLFREFGLVLAVAVAISSFVALSLVPAILARLPQDDDHPWFAGFGGVMKRGYLGSLNWVIRHPWSVLFIAVAAAGLAASLLGVLRSELIPPEDRSELFLFGRGPEGVGLSYSERQADRIENLLLPLIERGEVEQLYTVVGQWDPNIVFMTVSLSAWDQRERSQQDIMSELSPLLQGLPGISGRIFASNSLNIRGGSSGGVQLALLGTDYEDIFYWARQLANVIREQGRVAVNPRVGYEPSQPQVAIQIDRQRASDLAINLDDIAQTLRVMVDGLRIVDLNVDDQTVPISLESGSAQIDDPSDLTNLYLRNSLGQLVTLSSVVNLEEHGVAGQLDRRLQRRAIEFNVEIAPGETMQSTLDELFLLAEETLPDHITMIPRGEAATLGQTQSDTLITFAFALLIVFLVLVAQFESLMSALVIMITVPFGLAAAVFALFITNTSLNIYSQIGLVMLIGLIAKNGILLVEFADQCRDRDATVVDAIREAAEVRLRPIAMTLISTVLGALPLILASGPGSEARSAVGWVVFGGLGLAALFTLYLTPVLYLGLARFTKPRGTARARLDQELEAISEAQLEKGAASPQ